MVVKIQKTSWSSDWVQFVSHQKSFPAIEIAYGRPLMPPAVGGATRSNVGS